MNKIKLIAVDNFLASLDTKQPIMNHFMNLEKDAELYGWNEKTRTAIMRGICDAYESKISKEKK